MASHSTETYGSLHLLCCRAGRTIFHGPKEDVVDFFNGVGFRCPPRKGIPDFLQEVSRLHRHWALHLVTGLVCSCVASSLVHACMHGGLAAGGLVLEPF